MGPWPMSHLPIVDCCMLRRAGEHHHGEELDELCHCLQRGGNTWVGVGTAKSLRDMPVPCLPWGHPVAAAGVLPEEVLPRKPLVKMSITQA